MKTRSLIKLISVAAAVATTAISATTLMVGSYNEYQEYYEKIQAEKEYQEYLNSLGLEFVNLTVELKDGVGYYTDGLATPKNDDVIVRAHFTEKGRSFDKKVDSKDFTLEYAEDFAQKGGKIKVTYSYQPAREEGAETDPEPIVKEAEIEVSLIEVALEELKVKTMPNRVYYSTDMEFDPRGMELEAIYNNGHKKTIHYSAIEVKTTGKLQTSITDAEISYSENGTSISTLVPITVVDKESYQDGEIKSITADEGATVADGQKLSEVKLNVRANYLNGNRLYLNSNEYTVTGNTDVASFNYNCILTVTLKSNHNINCKTVAAVVYNQEIETAETVGGNKKTITEYNIVDGQPEEGKSIEVMDSFENGSSIKFKVNTQNLIKGALYLRATTSQDTGTILANTINVKINGNIVPVKMNAIVTKGVPYVFNNYLLNSPVLNAGENEIEISFKNVNPLKVQIDKIVFETKYHGSFSESITDYLIDKNNEGAAPEIETEKMYGFDRVNGGTYIHGMCTDGTYIYSIRTTYSSSERKALVTKQDMTTGEVLATSPLTEQAITEATAGVSYYDGKIIVFSNNGTNYSINASLSGGWTEYTGYDFDTKNKLILKDVSFAAGRQEFAVLTGSVVKVYKADKTFSHEFNILKDENGGYLKRMYANEKYIYTIFSKDGMYNPSIHIYDWSGTRLARQLLPHNLSATSPEITNSGSTNCQGLIVTNDNIYYSFLKFNTANGGDASAIMKVSYPEVKDKLEFKLTTGEYADLCLASGIEGSYTATGIDGNLGYIDVGTGGYAMAAVSDGTYTYYAMNTFGNKNTVIIKTDAVTHQVLARSAVIIDDDATSDTARLYIKDGFLYVIGFDGSKTFYIETKLFTDGCRFTLDSNKSFNDIAAKSITFNEEMGKYALVTSSGSLYIARANKSFEQENIALNVPSYWKVGSVATDDKYIYVNYTRNSQTTNPIDIFRWDGSYVGRIQVSGFNFGESTNFNIQSLVVVNDELHAILCSWDSGSKMYEWCILTDTSIL